MIVVCDTNVIISALLFPGGSPDKIWRAILSGRFQNATSPDLLTELERILRMKFKIPSDRVESLLTLVRQASLLTYPTRRLRIITLDDADNRVLECALESKSQFIVTGDKHHLLPLKKFQTIAILSPAAFLEQSGLV